MKILVTGSSGMVGKNFVSDLRCSSYKILSPKRSELDLTQFGSVLNYFKEHRPDMVVHCASRVGGIAANMKNPVEFLSENLDINKNVVMAAYETDVKRFLNLSSSCVYPRNAKNPLTEDLILTGELEPTNEGYAIAKIAALRLCSYITGQNRGFKYKTLIPCNLFGLYDHFDPQNSHLIPAVILKIHKAVESRQQEIDVWGDGTARREFMFAEDLMDCMFKCIADFDSVPDLMNVGLGFDYSITEYYQAIAEVIGYKGQFKYDISKPTGMKQKLVDVSKVNTWGWKSKTSLKDGVAKTYDYFLRTTKNEH